MIETCVIIGSGNVAFHIAQALQASRIRVVQMYARNHEKLQNIAQPLGIPFTSNANDILPNADIYLLCVSDSAIAQVAKTEALQNKFLVHVAGSISIDVLSPFTTKAGVMYPLQSFSMFSKLNYREIPFFTEASNAVLLNNLNSLALEISDTVTPMNGEQRLWLHLSAVIASNFSNHMYSIAHKILSEHNLSFDLLKPLISETSQKILYNTPQASQTGPAIRNNQIVMDIHHEMLSNHTDWQKIYTFVSKSIIQMKDNQ